MKLTPREKDKLMISMAANVARKRFERGVKLNYPEAIALITDFVIEGARDGKMVSELMESGAHVVKKEEGFSLMHSTFWLGMNTKFINPLLDLVLKPIANLKLTRKFLISDQLAKNLMLHCYEEMHHLSGFLPSLYKDKNPY